MDKLVIICNYHQHANTLLIDMYRLDKKRTIIVTPEQTDKLLGKQNFDYYALRPLYAREFEYIRNHGGNLVTLEEVVKKYRKPE